MNHLVHPILQYLRSADLRSADLSSANLRSANLSSANLRYAKYSAGTIWPDEFTPPDDMVLVA